MTDLIIKEIETESELKGVLELCYKVLGKIIKGGMYDYFKF